MTLLNSRAAPATPGLALLPAFFLLTMPALPGWSADNFTPSDARQAMQRAIRFFDESVSAEGGYLWRYSSDLALREGEGRAGAESAWVQPPGTPTVGEALLRAYQVTGDTTALRAAKRTAHALSQGQLVSGGWDYRIEFGEARQRYRYRVGPQGARNTTTLDDNTTQAALQFLMKLDRELKQRDESVHQTALYALNRLLEAQYPNGAWPQRFDGPPKRDKYPVIKASYPQTWPRQYPKADYRLYYTFNDNSIADMIRTMFMAHEIYGEARYRDAALKAGDFIRLAQMPEPQPAWAQQYNAQMEPAWARKFEPPAVTGGESQGVLTALLDLYDLSGERRFLEPVPKALAYLKRSLRKDGRLARFYELKTNKPLYFTKDYQLTYSDDDMPTHYGFIVGSNLDRIQRRYRALLADGPSQRKLAPRPSAAAASSRSQQRAKEAADALDQRGAWVTRGDLRTHDKKDVAVIETRVFVERLRTLAAYAGSGG